MYRSSSSSSSTTRRLLNRLAATIPNLPFQFSPTKATITSQRLRNPIIPPSCQGPKATHLFCTLSVRRKSSFNFLNLRFYARDRQRSNYNLFGDGRPGDEKFRKGWENEVEEDSSVWTGSEDDDDSDNDNAQTSINREIRKVRRQAKEHSDLIDADDSDELRSVWSGSDEDKTLWTGSEGDDDDDIPTDPYPNEKSDQYIDKLFEFEEKPKYRTISELLKAENEPEELSPGKQARKLAVENALKKLKKGPDGRYTNVWEVMSDIDILIGAFENIVSGPEYEELRLGGPKRLNMEFFKDIQARMRDPNYKFSPELKLRPKKQTCSKEEMAKGRVQAEESAKR